jgi:hypothetical protein
MRIVGIVTTTVGGLVAVLAVLLGVRSVPDLRRYLRIRSM